MLSKGILPADNAFLEFHSAPFPDSKALQRCRGEITDADRAVLTLKTQRRKLSNEQERLETLVAREMQVRDMPHSTR